MLEIEKILRSFALFSDLNGKALEPWQEACAAAGARLEKRLRPEVDLEQAVDMDRLCAAAGAMAYADYLMMGRAGAGAAGEIKVGDITVKNSTGAVEQDARDIVDYFMEQVADLLRPTVQVLRQVEV